MLAECFISSVAYVLVPNLTDPVCSDSSADGSNLDILVTSYILQWSQFSYQIFHILILDIELLDNHNG